MSLAKYRIAFSVQRHGAGRRGIGWELTFEQWLEWWGEDIERRGVRPGDLQMQRIADAGPYALGNIKKGTPRQNAQTRAAVLRNRQGCEAVQARHDRDERLIEQESGEKLFDLLDEDEQELHKMFYPRSAMSCMLKD
ncbi:hypothetical protein [Burkholderia cenocepacia]|jgi:hypothetical protein|uniref:hypothetical protein n=1 Tax=Burkholderia cenocepacia TaxID=95486 RepID=UPI00264D4AC8|nr:hypothetical protein [Burkholderia cenocepacia]MDN7658457.1 hypothetical protein [Burkholderia cenocepacia]